MGHFDFTETVSRVLVGSKRLHRRKAYLLRNGSEGPGSILACRPEATLLPPVLGVVGLPLFLDPLRVVSVTVVSSVSSPHNPIVAKQNDTVCIVRLHNDVERACRRSVH